MGNFSNILRVAALGGSLAANTGLAGEDKTLPRNPDSVPPAARTTQDTEPSSVVKQKIWTKAEVYQEIGALRATLTIVDGYFAANPADSRASEWRKARVKLQDYGTLVEKALNGDPSAAELMSYGSALDAQHLGIAALYPGVKISSPSPESNPFLSGKRGDSQLNVPLLGTFEAQDFLALKQGARLSEPLLRQYFTRDGRKISGDEQFLLDAIGKINTAGNPAELSESLAPDLQRLVGTIQNLGKSGQAVPQGPLTELMDKLKSAAAQPKQSAATQPSTTQLGWYTQWNTLVEADKVPHLHPAGKAYHDSLKFKDLVSTTAGFNQVKSDAEILFKYISERLRDPAHAGEEKTKRLSDSLNAIRLAKDAKQLPADAFDTMLAATKLHKAEGSK